MNDLSGLLPGYFFYGLSFVFLGVLLIFQPYRGTRSEFTDSLWFLGLFALIHGLNEWLDMFVVSSDLPLRLEALLRLVSAFVHTMALLCLFQFSVNLLFPGEARLSGLRWAPVVVFGAWLVLFTMGAVLGLQASFRFFLVEQSLRYGLGLLGGILAAYALIGFHAESLSPSVRRLLLCTAVFFGINAILSLFVASDASFRGWFGLMRIEDGSQMLILLVFRAICAMLVAITIVYALMRIDVDQNALLRQQKEELLQAHEALRESFDRLHETQQQLVHSEKMSAIGTLVSGLAHEYNNILAGMKGFVQLARMSREMDEVQRDLEVLEESTDRAIEITGNLLSWARPDKLQRDLVEVNTVVRQTVALVENPLGKSNVTIRTHLRDVPPLRVSKAELQDIVLNLVINATHAIGSRPDGLIDVTTDVRGDMAVIEVRDNGCGIPVENLHRIFLPFFTTKGALGDSETPGSGLGLYVVCGIVQGHGGDVQVESQTSHGTVFRIFLPIPEPQEAEPAPPPAEAEDEMSSILNGLRVLVVDDEVTVREAIVRFLEPRTAGVVSAGCGQEALDLLTRHEFGIVFLDLMMPGLNGLETLRLLRQKKPELPVLLMTGRVDLDLRDQVVQRGAQGLIKKPFDLHELVRVMGQTARKKQRRSMA